LLIQSIKQYLKNFHIKDANIQRYFNVTLFLWGCNMYEGVS